jgi:hypothetical protein
MDALKLILNTLVLFFNLLSLHEDLIKFLLQLLVVILHMLISVFDVFRSCIGAEFVKSKVKVGELSFELSYFVV